MGNDNGEALVINWQSLYISFLEQVSSENPQQLAEKCYLFLKACCEIEERVYN
jgi:hypothetical protein